MFDDYSGGRPDPGGGCDCGLLHVMCEVQDGNLAFEVVQCPAFALDVDLVEVVGDAVLNALVQRLAPVSVLCTDDGGGFRAMLTLPQPDAKSQRKRGGRRGKRWPPVARQ